MKIYFPAYKFWLTFFCLSCLIIKIPAQNKLIDSLQGALKNSKEDTAKVNLLLKLGDRQKQIGDYEAGMKEGDAALSLSKKLGFLRGEAAAHNLIGNLFNRRSEYPQALDHYYQALKINEETGDKRGCAGKLNNIGLVYYHQGAYPRALEYYFKALKINEELDNKVWKANNYGNIGVVYVILHDYTKALEYYQKALKLAEEMGDKDNIGGHLANIGSIYDTQGDYSAALDYYFRSLTIREALGDKEGMSHGYSCIGNMYKGSALRNKNRDSAALEVNKAKEYYWKALRIDEEIGNKTSASLNLNNLGLMFARQENYSEAEKYLKKALLIAESIGDLNGQKNLYHNLSEVFEKQKRWTEALDDYKRYIGIRDSIFNEENTKREVRAEMNFSFEKKEAATKLEQEKREAVATAESKKQKIVIWSVCGILLLVGIFAVFAYRSYLQKLRANIEITRQKEIIEEKQKEIVDSIRYARRIQRALLTPDAYIERSLNKKKFT